MDLPLSAGRMIMELSLVRFFTAVIVFSGHIIVDHAIIHTWDKLAEQHLNIED